MKEITSKGGEHLPCGMISLKMFQIPHSKAMIIAYLDLRSGPKFPGYNFNVEDISKKTNLGTTVVRQYVKALVGEGVLKRLGKSFYQLNRPQMEGLYYRSNVSENDRHVSETDTKLSESDTNLSKSDSIHSSNLNSRILNSRNLDSKVLTQPECNENSGFGGPVTGNQSFYSQTSGKRAVISEVERRKAKAKAMATKLNSLHSGRTAPAKDDKKNPNDSGPPSEKAPNHQRSVPVPENLEMTKERFDELFGI